MNISVLILTFNEQQNIAACLKSVGWSDDVLVVDSFSTDRTVELARQAGARVLQNHFVNFAEQRNFGLSQGNPKHEWVLHLDADEVVTDKLRDEILAAVQRPGKEAYQVASRLMFQGRWLMAEARIDLKRVILNSTNAFLCSQSRRELIIDAMRFNDFNTALTLSQELARQTNANFPDKLLRLDVLNKIQSPEFKPALASYQSEAATSPVKLYDLANWQISRLSPADALGWLQSLPMQTRTNQPAALLAAQCQIAVRDWKGAQDFLQNQNWAELEFERHALLARCLRERNLEQSAKAEWQLALNGAAGNKMALNAIFRLAAQWRWASETEQILWTIVNTFPEEQAAVQSLRQTLFAAGSTRPFMQLINIELRRNPSSLALKNDLAMVALLLNAQELKPHDLAREVYQKDPQNGSVASTYAFSLYSQGKPAEALKVMQSLNSRSLETPEIGSYYGLILKANGHLTEAKSYLKLSAKAHLLPEEKALFDQAKAGL